MDDVVAGLYVVAVLVLYMVITTWKNFSKIVKLLIKKLKVSLQNPVQVVYFQVQLRLLVDF